MPGSEGTAARPRHRGTAAGQAPEPARCPHPGSSEGRSAGAARSLQVLGAGAPSRDAGGGPAALRRCGLTHPISSALLRPLRRGLSRSLSAGSAAAPRAAHAEARARPVQPRRRSIPRAVLLLPPPPGAGGRGLGLRGLGSHAEAVPAPPRSPPRSLRNPVAPGRSTQTGGGSWRRAWGEAAAARWSLASPAAAFPLRSRVSAPPPQAHLGAPGSAASQHPACWTQSHSQLEGALGLP